MNEQAHSVQVTADNPQLADLKMSWVTAVFSADDGIGPMESLHQAGDSIIAVARMTDQGIEVIGSGVMIGPGLMLTASHVLDEFPPEGTGAVFLGSSQKTENKAR